MDLLQAIQSRHSVRQYTGQKIEGETLGALRRYVEECNQESGLRIQLRLNEPTAFSGMLARYGRFTNADNYIALVGKAGRNLQEKCGYYGEKIVLRAQQLGLNTCWVAGTYSRRKSKSALEIAPGEKLALIVALGYGATGGSPRKTRPIEELCRTEGPMPDWFRRAIEACQLAPTAMNQQKFHFALDGGTVTATAGSAPYARVDLGIAKLHFEIGAGDAEWKWAERRP